MPATATAQAGCPEAIRSTHSPSDAAQPPRDNKSTAARHATSDDVVHASPPDDADQPPAAVEIIAQQAVSNTHPALSSRETGESSEHASVQDPAAHLGDHSSSLDGQQLDNVCGQGAFAAGQPRMTQHMQSKTNKAKQTSKSRSSRPQPKHLAWTARFRSCESPAALQMPQHDSSPRADKPSPSAATAAGGAAGGLTTDLPEEVEEQHLCISCLDQPRQITFIPCSHILLCRQDPLATTLDLSTM